MRHSSPSWEVGKGAKERCPNGLIFYLEGYIKSVKSVYENDQHPSLWWHPTSMYATCLSIVTCSLVCALWPHQKLVSWACYLHNRPGLVFMVSSTNRKIEPFITLSALHTNSSAKRWCKICYKDLKRKEFSNYSLTWMMLFYKGLYRYRLTLHDIYPFPVCLFLLNSFISVSLFLDSLGGSLIPDSYPCIQKCGPVAGYRKYGVCWLELLFRSCPIADPRQPLFVYMSLSSLNDLNPVLRTEQCHFQRWEDCEHLSFCLSTESKQWNFLKEV